MSIYLNRKWVVHIVLNILWYHNAFFLPKVGFLFKKCFPAAVLKITRYLLNEIFLQTQFINIRSSLLINRVYFQHFLCWSMIFGVKSKFRFCCRFLPRMAKISKLLLLWKNFSFLMYMWYLLLDKVLKKIELKEMF